VILKSSGDDFRGGGAVAGNEDGERAGVGDFGIFVRIDAHATVGAFDADDGSGFDEEAGEANGFVEKTAAVATEIEDEAFDAGGFKLADEFFDVVGGAGFGAGGIADGAVEGGNFDDADGNDFPVFAGNFVNFRFGAAGHEADFVAHELDGGAGRGIGSGRDDGQ